MKPTILAILIGLAPGLAAAGSYGPTATVRPQVRPERVQNDEPGYCRLLWIFPCSGKYGYVEQGDAERPNRPSRGQRVDKVPTPKSDKTCK